MALAVIGAGFGRTGTLSLKVALEKVGHGRGYHMSEVFQNPDHVPLWTNALDGGRLDGDTLFDGYGSSTSWPGCAFLAELRARYPDAKVVLGLRDPASWYESISETVYRVIRRRADSPQAWRELYERLVWQNTFGGRFEDREHAIAVFERHNARVREQVPPAQLLEHRVGDGWKPLCDFLGVAVPDEPYPHLNDRASFAEIGKRLDRETPS